MLKNDKNPKREKVPTEFLPYVKEAKSFIESGAVGDIQFSGGTYQVQVIDPTTQQEFWAFLQLDDRGLLKDRFCSCETEGEVCVHLTAALLKIYSGHRIPLHMRFYRSFWNALCYYHPFIKSQQKYSEVEFPTIHPLNSEGEIELAKIFDDRTRETEETSLKFSGLTEHELRLWRRGTPTQQLQYELSPWSDFAKWLMDLQERNEKYQIEYTYGTHGLPNGVVVRFPQVEITQTFTLESLVFMIPTLSTVESPIKTHEAKIDKITYLPISGELHVETLDELKVSAEGIDIGDWIFVANDGFYPKQKHPLLENGVLTGRLISDALTDYYHLIKRHLQGAVLHQESVHMSYTLKFDSQWNLHVTGYIFEPNDLIQDNSRLFHEWVYIDGKGFYPVEGVVFPESEKIVSAQQIPDFIRQHRGWLNGIEGFQTHIGGFETELTYEVTDDNQLIFVKKAIVDEEDEGNTKDFGPWVYIKGEGFFSKVTSSIGLPVKSGVAIRPEQIPLFLRMYKDELELIDGFFSQACPVNKMGLRIGLNDDSHVVISPEYELLPQYHQKSVRFFEGFTYVSGDGFSRIPSEILLPERFLSTIELDEEVLPRFFAYELDEIREYATFIDPRLKVPQFVHLIADTLEQESSGYSLSLRYESDRGSVSIFDLLSAVKNKKRFIFSEIGFLDLTEDHFRWLYDIREDQIDRANSKLLVSTLDLLKLNVYETLLVKNGGNFLETLLSLKSPDKPDYSALKSHLRSYQEVGINWLWFLYRHELSGLLCDDMGLGKTHQTMALFAAVKKLKEGVGAQKIHFLIVCPTSVIYHWEEKLAEFLPSLRVCTFHGSGRSLDDFHHGYDILLTTYGIWRKELELLREVHFEVAVFDEIHAAKNQSSRLHTSLLAAKSRVRVGLTGTPIENRLRELKSLFDLILPNYMPGDKEYRNRFVYPIEQNGDPDKRQLLSRLIKPFMLRRKKEDVLLDLPEKTEEIAHCELVGDQIVLYNSVLKNLRAPIMEEIDERGAPIPYLHIFSALSSLKQICNHPAAYLKTPEAYKNYQSGKWDLFIELFSEAIESGQKVVVFSQYLAMLDIIELYLRENQVEYATIRGATTRRGEEIRRFNYDPTCRVFVGSLHAAGLGVDLTAGSVVIHYDRWWNAAREDQATDRVHRIGQTRGVQVFKLVSKGTFEERIDQMIMQKGKLMEDVVGVDDHRFIKQFNREEILLLLKECE